MSVEVRSDEELMHAYLDGEKNAIALLLMRPRLQKMLCRKQ
jgi:hypothetical protein